MKCVRVCTVGALVCAAIAISASSAKADWQYQGTVQGAPVYRDTNTGLVWTVTLGQVESSDWGKSARNAVQQRGFRLPSFNELQSIDSQGWQLLQIRADLSDYYETADPRILGNGAITGFQTPQNRLGIGRNWFLGVR